MKVRVWLRMVAVGSLGLAIAAFVTSLLFGRNLMAAFESSLIAASFGIPIGAIGYRQALSVPAASWHAVVVWAFSAILGAAMLLIALRIGGADFPHGATSVVDVAAMLGIAAITSAICFIPLRWLLATR